ncbi:uncharacterized protein LOC126956361 [Macaca thibetana thibetana]|uniref:uncharacterized protein LOC126956361 n=1 Tax=Macaca thibetana thibetana TaxID=257877 RepID=UPI0021BC81F9|nr:uncharacterized protein LOC126956361 [Macaca thibetana thibetana]
MPASVQEAGDLPRLGGLAGEERERRGRCAAFVPPSAGARAGLNHRADRQGERRRRQGQTAGPRDRSSRRGAGSRRPRTQGATARSPRRRQGLGGGAAPEPDSDTPATYGRSPDPNKGGRRIKGDGGAECSGCELVTGIRAPLPAVCLPWSRAWNPGFLRLRGASPCDSREETSLRSGVAAASRPSAHCPPAPAAQPSPIRPAEVPCPCFSLFGNLMALHRGLSSFCSPPQEVFQGQMPQSPSDLSKGLRTLGEAFWNPPGDLASHEIW